MRVIDVARPTLSVGSLGLGWHTKENTNSRNTIILCFLVVDAMCLKDFPKLGAQINPFFRKLLSLGCLIRDTGEEAKTQSKAHRL